MQASSPAEVHTRYAEGFNRGDVDAVLDLYHNDAVVVVESGSTVSGRDAIRALLSGFLAIGGRMRIETLGVLECAGTALLESHWTIEGTGADGAPIAMECHGTEVVRRGADGSWRFVIDNPYATAAPVQAAAPSVSVAAGA